jgi:hypothetical protein
MAWMRVPCSCPMLLLLSMSSPSCPMQHGVGMVSIQPPPMPLSPCTRHNKQILRPLTQHTHTAHSHIPRTLYGGVLFGPLGCGGWLLGHLFTLIAPLVVCLFDQGG